jgi:hypothetical protein
MRVPRWKVEHLTEVEVLRGAASLLAFKGRMERFMLRYSFGRTHRKIKMITKHDNEAICHCHNNEHNINYIFYYMFATMVE